MTLHLLGKAWPIKHDLQVVNGHWMFTVQTKRELFSLLDSSWLEVVQRDEHYSHGALRPETRLEYLLLLCTLPVFTIDMRLRFCGTVLCSDASEYGGGVCASTGLTEIAGTLVQ